MEAEFSGNALAISVEFEESKHYCCTRFRVGNRPDTRECVLKWANASFVYVAFVVLFSGRYLESRKRNQFRSIVVQ